MPDNPIPPARVKTLRLLLVALLVMLCLSSCPSPPPLSLTPEEQSWLADHKGQLQVFLEAEVPPYAFQDETGEYKGFFVDYLQEIEELLGQKLILRKFPLWSELIAEAKKERNFIILNIAQTEERARFLLFTAPLVKVPYALVTRKTSQAKSIPEFAEKTLCTVAGYAVNDDLARHFPHVPPTGVKNSVRGFQAVSSGTCDGMVINQMEASYLMETLGLTNLHIAGQTSFLNRLAAATSIHDPMLFSILDKTLEQISPTRRRDIYAKWVSGGTLWLPSSLRVILQIIAGSVLCIIFLLWGWSTSLKKQVERQTRQVRESNENLRITLNSIGDGVMATDTDGRITGLNPVAVALTGWTLAEAKGKEVTEVLQLKDVETQQPMSLPEPAACDVNEKKTATHEAVLISRSEETHRIHFSVSPIRDGACNPIGTVLVFRDITDNVKAEEQRLRFKKLESLGILAGGIAHDFNNLLTGLYGYISMAKMDLPSGHQALEHLSFAEESMDAAVALTRQFLTFSKDEKPVKKVINLAQTLEETASFTSHGLNTQLEKDIEEGLWPVSADKGQIGQVVGNLIINAHQAMTTGGLITLTAKNVHEPTARHVRITVTDEGCGIPPENLDKIFDPYFTTKKTGSGLGLATTYAIITKHHGTISVDSEPGKGTTFTITLPAAAESLSTPSEERLEELIDTYALKAHILVLDDQAVIRKILKTIITKLGFEVTFTVEGSETVAAYKKRLDEGSPYDAVILDLTIPGGMGGREASELILTMDPDARLIISSGHAADPIMSNYEEYGIKAIAVKPYRFSDFKEILLRVLLDR